MRGASDALCRGKLCDNSILLSWMESCFLAERIQLLCGYLLLGLLALRGRGCTHVVLCVSVKPAGISLQLCLRFAVCFRGFVSFCWFFFFLRWSNLGCPGERFCNSWLLTSNIYGQPDAKAFAKKLGQAELCCAGAVQGTVLS